MELLKKGENYEKKRNKQTGEMAKKTKGKGKMYEVRTICYSQRITLY